VGAQAENLGLADFFGQVIGAEPGAEFLHGRQDSLRRPGGQGAGPLRPPGQDHGVAAAAARQGQKRAEGGLGGPELVLENRGPALVEVLGQEPARGQAVAAEFQKSQAG